MNAKRTSTCQSCGRDGVEVHQNRALAIAVCVACAWRSRKELCSACGQFRDIHRRNPDGTSTCSRCFRREVSDRICQAERQVIVEAVARLEPQLDVATVTAAVEAACGTRRRLESLAGAVRADPDCLTTASSRAPREADALVGALLAAGATRLQVPVCALCAKRPPVLYGRTGRRLCPTCILKSHVGPCAGCGQHKPVYGRAADGGALCPACTRRDPKHQRLCSACGQLGHISLRRDGEAICRRCYRRPHAVCDGCGQKGPTTGGRGRPRLCASCRPPRRHAPCAYCGREAQVAAVWAAGPACSSCYHRVMATKGTCDGCGQRRRIDPRGTSGRDLCSDCAGLAPMGVCAGCGGEDRIWRDQRCLACNLADRLDAVLAGADGNLAAHLAPLRAALASTTSPRAVLRWLAQPRVESVLVGLARGDLALDHATIDQMGDDRRVGHLRQVLVSSGVLPERDQTVAALEAWVEHQLGLVDNAEDRHLVGTYATWWVVRRRRYRQARRPTTDRGYDRTSVASAIELVGWLRSHQKALASCTQADIDLWLASGPSRRCNARTFVRWARRQHLCGQVDIARRPGSAPVPTAEVAALAAIARRLLSDDTVNLADRVAGLLVILYGQTLSRIADLEVGHIGGDDQVTTIVLGKTPVELPEPLGQLVRRLANSRTGHAALGHNDGRWLIPGGRPGRHIGPERLQVRLNRLGIRARAARTTMLLELAGELAPAVIADMLGLNPATAVRWVKAAAGDWGAYAAARARSA